MLVKHVSVCTRLDVWWQEVVGIQVIDGVLENVTLGLEVHKHQLILSCCDSQSVTCTILYYKLLLFFRDHL